MHFDKRFDPDLRNEFFLSGNLRCPIFPLSYKLTLVLNFLK